MSTVLVTGGTGFIGSHCILQLLNAGHRVRTTVRSLTRESELRAMLQQGGVEAGENLTCVVADLMQDAGWIEAAQGCDFVLHVASPLPVRTPRDEDELIRPACEGTQRVLKAARDAGVRRVVLTSSFAAIGYGHPPRTAPFTEDDWTDIHSPDAVPYVKSKTLAEQGAWEFLRREGNGLELAVVNPVVVLGPVLGPDYSASISLVKMMLSGWVPGCPHFSLGLVDVRDVADLHLRAMTHPAAAGERFLAISGDSVSLLEIAKRLKALLGKEARRVSTWPVPDWMVRVAACLIPQVRRLLPHLGRTKQISSEKAIRMLGWKPRPIDESLVATARSLQRQKKRIQE